MNSILNPRGTVRGCDDPYAITNLSWWFLSLKSCMEGPVQSKKDDIPEIEKTIQRFFDGPKFDSHKTVVWAADGIFPSCKQWVTRICLPATEFRNENRMLTVIFTICTLYFSFGPRYTYHQSRIGLLFIIYIIYYYYIYIIYYYLHLVFSLLIRERWYRIPQIFSWIKKILSDLKATQS